MRLLAITHRRLLPHPDELPLLTRRWSQAGVAHIQLREKDLAAPALRELTLRVLETLQPHTEVSVNVGHLPPQAQQAAQDWAPALHLSAPPAFPAQRPFGISAHSPADAGAAQAAGAALILFGPVWEKPLWTAVTPGPTHNLPGTGLALLREAALAAHPTPLYALGGITTHNAQQCLAVGASGVAGIRLFLNGSYLPLLAH
jgi:thiamine-phosphate pyrophosphorylase